MEDVREPGSASGENFGSVLAIWRYPVKSMVGEELATTLVTERGLLGDRTFAVVDSASGKVASAKNPRKWGKLFEFRARLLGPPGAGPAVVPAQITFPDGSTSSSSLADIDRRLSDTLGVEVRLATPTLENPGYEEYWPDVEGLSRRDQITDETMPPNTFFDCAVVHLITTASLGRLSELYPAGQFDARRFRPNLVIETASSVTGFVENEWVGRTIAIGDEVRLRVTGLTGRCVMTTLPQTDLPRDVEILKTVARHNRVIVGAYAAVERGGTVKKRDPVRLVQ